MTVSKKHPVEYLSDRDKTSHLNAFLMRGFVSANYLAPVVWVLIIASYCSENVCALSFNLFGTLIDTTCVSDPVNRDG